MTRPLFFSALQRRLSAALRRKEEQIRPEAWKRRPCTHAGHKRSAAAAGSAAETESGADQDQIGSRANFGVT